MENFESKLPESPAENPKENSAENEKGYCIVWEDPETGEKMRSEPLVQEDAEKQLEKVRKENPEIKHWLEEKE